MRLRELAANRVRFGYRRLTMLLRREGWAVNAKRIYRLYTEYWGNTETLKSLPNDCRSQPNRTGHHRPRFQRTPRLSRILLRRDRW